MRAVFVTRTGGPEVLELGDAPDPQPRAGQVMVQVQACGVNFADISMARGTYPGSPPPPFIAGREFSGVRLDTNEPVMGYCQGGAFAERVAISPRALWPRPGRLSAEEGAAIPVNFFTAYFLYWKAGLLASQPTQEPRSASSRPRVLIHAAAGGVGTAAVQIGKLLGVESFGTSSSDEKLARAKELGLNHAINYRQDDYEAKVLDLTGGEGVDAVFEMLGGEHTAKSTRCLRFLGRVILYGTATGQPHRLDINALYSKQASAHGLWLSPLSQHAELMAEAWRQLAQWIEQGAIRPVIGHVLSLDRAGEAFRLLLDRQNYGKVVLNVAS